MPRLRPSLVALNYIDMLLEIRVCGSFGSLGLLGVPPGYPRLAALLAALVLFSTNYSLLYRHDVRSFPRQFAASRERISALATDSDARNEGLRRLAALEKDELSGLRPFASVLGFIIGWMAWSSSVIATLISIWNS